MPENTWNRVVSVADLGPVTWASRSQGADVVAQSAQVTRMNKPPPGMFGGRIIAGVVFVAPPHELGIEHERIAVEAPSPVVTCQAAAR